MKLGIGVVVSVILATAALSSTASAMPIAPAPQVSNVEQARWVCDPYRCWWQPNYGYGYNGYYGRPRYHGYYGYHGRHGYHGHHGYHGPRNHGGWGHHHHR